MKIIVVSLFIILYTLSCDWIFRPGPCDASGPIVVYKTRQDYSGNVTIQLSKNHMKVIAYPGPGDAAGQRPIQLAKGYLLKRMVGDAVLSLTIDDYVKEAKFYSHEELLRMVIDTSPYIEKYECCECTGKDTVKINDLIRKDLLGKCENIN
jgi:hypothetical protein